MDGSVSSMLYGIRLSAAASIPLRDRFFQTADPVFFPSKADLISIRICDPAEKSLFCVTVSRWCLFPAVKDLCQTAFCIILVLHPYRSIRWFCHRGQQSILIIGKNRCFPDGILDTHQTLIVYLPGSFQFGHHKCKCLDCSCRL